MSLFFEVFLQTAILVFLSAAAWAFFVSAYSHRIVYIDKTESAHVPIWCANLGAGAQSNATRGQWETKNRHTQWASTKATAFRFGYCLYHTSTPIQLSFGEMG